MSKKEQFIHIDEEGNKIYYSDREMTIQHREDGPAIEYADGGKLWYINGEKLNFIEKAVTVRMNPVELTLEEIAEKFGVSVDQIKIKK
jgi:phage baseplate assembly protein gpV